MAKSDRTKDDPEHSTDDLGSQDPERVARRAFERFQARGAEHGRDQEDWFEAERELRADRRVPS